MEDTKVRKGNLVGTIPRSTPLQSQTSPMEILVLDASPKPIRKRMSMPLLHEDEESKLLPSHGSKLESPTIIDRIYENNNFTLPIVETKMFPSQERLYEEVRKDDGSVHIYDLSQICDGIPKDTKVVDNDRSHPMHKLAKKSSSFTEKPPFPRQQHKHSNAVENSYYISNSLRASPATRASSTTRASPTNRASPTTQRLSTTRASPTSAAKSKTSAPISPVNTNSNMDSSKKSSVKRSSTLSGDDTTTKTQPHHNKPSSVSSTYATVHMLSRDDTTTKTQPHHNKPSSVSSTYATVHGGKEENVAYLKTFSLANMLQLLDNMNLGEYKKQFKDERIDGEIIVHLDKGDLVELGVSKNIHQTRLLKLIDGTMSAKKYQHAV